MHHSSPRDAYEPVMSTRQRLCLITAATLLLCSCRTSSPRQQTAQVRVDLAPVVDSVAVTAGGQLGAAANHAAVLSRYHTGVVPSPPGLVVPESDENVRPEDEYICDGGDSAGSVVLDDDWSLRGLDPEDTVAHFDTERGNTVIKASNRVCIYAPRFAAVRKITSVFANERATTAVGLERPLKPVGQDDLQIVTAIDQPLTPNDQVAARIANSLNEHLHGIGIDNKQSLLQADEGVQPHENVKLLEQDELNATDKAQLAEAGEAAVIWNDTQAVQVVIDGQQAVVASSSNTVQSVYVYELRGKTRFKLVKLASTADANPGELVEFELHFENTGTETIANLSITDSLTTRLEYVPDSQQCSLQAEFSSARNDADSLVLRWDVKDPLPVGQSGTVRFSCRVR